jgi:hypothetical protein
VADTPERLRQLEAFARLDRIMTLDMTPSAKAAAIVLDVARRARGDPTGAISPPNAL